MTKPLLLEFRDKSNKPSEDGLKLVLFQLFRDGKMIGFDYGFANFENKEFENIENDGATAMVIKWAEMPNPQLLL